MHSKKILDWLQKNNFIDIVKKNSSCFKKILLECPKVKNEEILIIGDLGAEGREIPGLFAGNYYFAAKELGLKTNFVLQTPKKKGELAEKDVAISLENLEDENVVVFCLSNALGKLENIGKSYRKYAKKRNFKFLSAGGLGGIDTKFFPKVVNAVNIDYEALKIKAAKIKNLLDIGKELNIKTEAGTNLHIGIKGMKAAVNDGEFHLPGKGGNIPCGEVYIPPENSNVEGVVVIDGSSRNREGTVLIKKPIIIKIEDGTVVEIKGGKEAKLLEKSLEWAHSKAKIKENVKKLGEFGIGINPNAEIIGSTMVDEKSLGTAHVAIGSNSWFGGNIYTIIHLDQVFKNPDIFIDGKKLDLN